MRLGLTGALLAIVVIAIAAYAIGAGNRSKDLLLCATKKGGNLSLATAKGKCGKGEKKLTVAKEGPVGPPGPAGSAANVVPEAIQYVTGPANAECFAKPGTFCKAESGYITWSNLDPAGTAYGQVGYYKDASGVVHLTGVASASVGGVVYGFQPEGPFYLPPAYRPGVVKMFTVPSQVNPEEEFKDSLTVVVRPNGVVALKADNYREVALDGVAFRLP